MKTDPTDRKRQRLYVAD